MRNLNNIIPYDFAYYSDDMFSTIAVFEKDEQYLAISRKDNYNDFGFVGGKIDKTEFAYTAMCREVREEVGVRIINALPFFLFPDSKGRLCLAFYIEKYEGELRSLEGPPIKWVSPEFLELPTNTYHEYNKELFKHLRELEIKSIIE